MEPRAALVAAASRRGGRPRLNDAGRERKTWDGGAASSRPCRATDRRRFAVAILASCHRTAVVTICCCRISPSHRWRRSARQFYFCF
ncbi:hypothetical protein AHAS_Ahas20G0194400 [Arachis hypogaea]